MEDGGLAGQFLGLVGIGEGDVQVLFFADGHADHLILKTGDEGAAADDQGLVFGGAALKGDAVHGAGIVQVDGVAVLHGAVRHVLHGGGFVHVALDALVNVLRGDLVQILDGLEALVFAQLHVRLHIHQDGEFQVLADAHLVHLVDLGTVHHGQVVFFHRLLIHVRENDVQSVFIKNAVPVHLFDDLAGSVALAEAGHLDAAAHFEICLLHGGVKFRRRNVKSDFYLIA